MRRRVAALALGFLVAGCSSSAEPADPSGASSSGSGGGGADAPPALTTYDASVGPITIAPGVERTVCMTVRAKNAEAGYVRRFRADLGQGSHHMIVYRSPVQTEYPDPQECFGFSGAFVGNHPIFIAQQPKAVMELPTDEETQRPVGVAIGKEQMLFVELHYINTTDAPLDIAGTIHLDTVPLSDEVIPSDMAFWGTGDIDIPPNGEWSTPVKFQSAIADTKTFALTTHQHHLGTRMRVWHATSADDLEKAPVADEANWSDPALELFDPPLAHPDSGDGATSSLGFAYQCEWKNTSAKHVGFGESFNDEMCFLWHYYYPSQGFQACTDGKCEFVGGAE